MGNRPEMPPSSVSENKPNKQHQGASIGSLVSNLAYYSILKIEAVCSSETSVNFYQATRSYIAELMSDRDETT
jgi:hypothetical protein